MKKLTFSIFAAALAFGANADVEPAETAATNCSAYDGFFFGLGVSAVDSGIKTETTAASGVNDSHKTVPASLDNDIGIDTSDHDTRFTGNVTLGFGRRIKEKAYVALEAGLDLGQSSNFHHAGIATTEGKNFEVVSKNHSFIPSVGLRLGYVHPETKNMVYLRAGVAYSQAKTAYTDNYVAEYNADDPVFDRLPYNGKCSKWTPIVALGFEKVTGKNFRTRAEVEYRFQTTRSFDFNNNGRRVEVNTNTVDARPYNGTVKIYNKAAVTLRVMGIYTVK